MTSGIISPHGGEADGPEHVQSAPEPASSMRDGKGRFLTGNTGGGRPRGARNKLTEVLVSAIADDFAEHGSETLARLRQRDPEAYLKIVSSLVPRELILEREQAPNVDLADITLEEFHAMMVEEHRRKFIRDSLSRVDGALGFRLLAAKDDPDSKE